MSDQPNTLDTIADRGRMAIWLALGLVLYALSLIVGPNHPLIQTTLYKLGHVTTLAFVGYWVARNGIGRLSETADLGDKLGRALVMGAVIIAGSLGI